MIFTGRLLIASLFILGALNKIMNYGSVLESMNTVGLPVVDILLPLTIILELFGGLFVLIGKKYHVEAAIVLAVFTLLTNLVFHNFWAMSEPVRSTELSLFFKNIVVIGALLYIAGIGFQQRREQ